MSQRFNRILVGDWETTGIPDPFNLEPYVTGPQGIQCGMAVVEDIYDTWEIVDEFQMTLKWLGPDKDVADPDLPGMTWNEGAYRIHGMSKTYLREMPHPEDMASPYRKFLSKSFSPGEPMLFCGHNPSFDMYFNYQFILFSGLVDDASIRFHHRLLDTFTAGLFALGLANSDELFEAAGCPPRSDHNAMEDVRHTVQAARFITQQLGGIPIPQ